MLKEQDNPTFSLEFKKSPSTKAKFSKTDYLNTRVPASNQSRIIVPCNSLGTEEYLEHLLAKQDFDEVIDGVNNIIKHAWTKKRFLDNQKISMPICYVMSLFLFLAISSGIILTFYIYYSLDPVAFDVAMITGFLGTLITFFILLSSVC